MHERPWLVAIATLGLTASSSAQTPERPWTLMVYAAVDNDAEEGFVPDFAHVPRIVRPEAGMEVVLLIDRAEGLSRHPGAFGEDFTDTRLYRVGERRIERLDGGTDLPDIRSDSEFEADTSDPETLVRFVRFAKRRFPARHYALVLYGHANGRAMLPDDGAGGNMGIAEISAVSTAADAVDLVVCDLCAMGGIEIAYQWRPGNGAFQCDTLVAIPSSGEALPWERILPRLFSEETELEKLTPHDLARVIVDETEARRRQKWGRFLELSERRRQILGLESAAVYDLHRAAAAKAAVDAWASILHRDDAREALERVRGPGPKPTAMQYRFDPERTWTVMPYFDLYDLARRAAADDAFTAEARAAAEEVKARVDQLVVTSFGMHGLADFAPGKCGVYVTFPDGSRPLPTDGGEPAWSVFAYYSPARGPHGSSFGDLAWCRDGAVRGNGRVENWFEMLDAWYDRQGEDGGYNGYRW